MDIKDLERRLSSFDAEERRHALEKLAASKAGAAAETSNVNLHCHTFFSYNSRDWSPSRIAWEASKHGLYAVGICDFDSLDGQKEFIGACDLLELRGLVNLETRSFVSDLSDVEIDSPGEPGVSYCMGCGFAREVPSGSPLGMPLLDLRKTSSGRNKGLIDRINGHLPKIAIDYTRDVLPLTPARNATERHIIVAYINKAREVFEQKDQLTGFWAQTLDVDPDDATALIEDENALADAARARLAKRGGPGYVQPTQQTFPAVEDFWQWVRDCGAVPMESWLDGISVGEADAKALLEGSWQRGARALNLIPDRNWNISDPGVRERKVENLARVVEAARNLGMPLHIGTELNKTGQPLYDDLDCGCLEPFRADFLRGARILAGHAVAYRFANFSYAGEDAEAEFGKDTAAKNNVFETIGGLPPLNEKAAERLSEFSDNQAFSIIRDSASRCEWRIPETGMTISR